MPKMKKRLNGLTYKFTKEELKTLEEAEFIKFKVFVHEVGQVLGLNLSVEDTGKILINSDGVERVVSEEEFSAYLFSLADVSRQNTEEFTAQVFNLVNEAAILDQPADDTDDNDDNYRLC